MGKTKHEVTTTRSIQRGLSMSKCRNRRRWTQEYLAKASGISYNTIVMGEKGGNISVDSAAKLARALEITLDEYIGLEPLPPKICTKAIDYLRDCEESYTKYDKYI